MRQYIRHPVDIPIEYELKEGHEQKVSLQNLSVGGLCFRTKEAIRKRTAITIRILLTRLVEPIEGVVVWCGTQDGHFEVGVRFRDDRTAFQVRMIEQVCLIEQYRNNAFAQEGRVLSAEEAAQEWVERYAKDFPAHASISR